MVKKPSSDQTWHRSSEARQEILVGVFLLKLKHLRQVIFAPQGQQGGLAVDV